MNKNERPALREQHRPGNETELRRSLVAPNETTAPILAQDTRQSPHDAGGNVIRAYVPEPLLTLKDVAKRLGLPAFKVTRAAKLGIFPTYTLLNNRKLARLSEVVAAIERSRTGGRS